MGVIAQSANHLDTPDTPLYPKFPCRYREIVVFDTPTAAATSPMLGCRFVFVLLMTPIVHHSHVIAEHPR